MIPERFLLELPWVLAAGIPVALAVLAWTTVLLARRRIGVWRTAALVALRGLGLLTLIVLLARPTSIDREDPRQRERVALLLDRSESMALVEEGKSRYERLLELSESNLVAAFEGEGWKVDSYLFADHAVPATAAQRRGAIADGPVTDLGTAIAHAIRSAPLPPLAVVALSDGAANESAGNRAALLSLVETATPFIGVGLGSDRGLTSLSLDRLEAPAAVPPSQEFRIAAHLQATGEGEIPAFDLMLLRDGRMIRSKSIPAGQGSRLWSESFVLEETEEGVYDYTVELQLPPGADLVTVSTSASQPVRVAEEKEVRVLFVQGALTWNFKFIGRALKTDPAVLLTGLSRTSEQSFFRQNVESAGELLDGFPEELKEIVPFRVVVLSDLRPADLTTRQQDVVARFAAELGGGVLMIGGASTFDGSWRGSRLEALLPVAFDTDPGVLGLDRPFHLKLTETARRHPVFQLDDGGRSGSLWESLPTFTQYGRVRAAKPGATVWARHSADSGEDGRRVLIASQPYGAGVSAVVAIQNLWRWRLARDADPVHFDRFWRQFLRFLGQSGSQEISIQVIDQDRTPGRDITALVERRAKPEGSGDAGSFVLRVSDPSKREILEQRVELQPLRPIEVVFRAEAEGLYTVSVADSSGVAVASQPVEIKNVGREMARTGRDMENLRQWAGISRGLALPVEDCGDAAELIARIRERIEALSEERFRRRPVLLKPITLLWLLLCFGGEWALRKRFNLA